MEITRRALVAGSAALLTARPVRAQSPLVLRAAEADVPLGAGGLSAPAFNGLAAGPSLELGRGEPFALKIENALDFPFFFRPQGLRGKAVKGGESPIGPGEVRDLVVTAPDAGTFVYRAEPVEPENRQRTVLLSGALLVRADQPKIADRQVSLALNALLISEADATAPPHRIALVNGSTHMKLEARPGERLRLQFANLAQEAVSGVQLPEGTQVVALDGQPCEPFPPYADVMVLPPLARADLLLTIPTDATKPLVIADVLDPTSALVEITPAGEPLTDRYLAKQLPENLALPKEIPMGAAKRITLKAGQTAPDPAVQVKPGASLVLTFENGAAPHALVLEGHSARLLDALDDGWKPWWHDTLLIEPEQTVRLAFRAEEPGRYAVDLIPLEGDAAAARAWITVTP